MNLRYQETFCIIFLLCTSITLGEDFDFVPETNDDVEPIAAEPLKVDSQTKLIHPKVSGRCLPTESTIKLSLGLQSKNWKHVQTSLKQRTVSKLAEYFLVPEESFIVQNAKSAELHRMVEKALHHGKKPPRSGKSLGWIGFPVGCGEKMSASAKETVRNLNTQLGEIRDLTGMDFGWWVIWKDQPMMSDKLSARIKREVDEGDYIYDYGDEEASDDDDDGETTEVPHAHRHHHGSSEYSTKNAHTVPTHATNLHTNKNDEHGHKIHPAGPDESGKASKHGTGAGAEHRKSVPMVDTAGNHSIGAQTQPPKRKHNHGLYDQVKERSAKKHPAVQQQPVGPVTEVATGTGFTPPDLRESVSQLESTISKTIANNEQLKKEEDKLLARKAKHKHIDIERIVETELLMPELERLQDEVFRDDYVIEDAVKVPTFYDFTTSRTQPDGPGKPVAGSTVKTPAVTVKKDNPIIATSTVPQKSVGNDATTATITSTPVTVGVTSTTEMLVSSSSMKLPRPEITPLVSTNDVPVSPPTRTMPTTTTGTGTDRTEASVTTPRKAATIITPASFPGAIDAEPRSTVTGSRKESPPVPFDLSTATILTTADSTTTPASTVGSTRPASTITTIATTTTTSAASPPPKTPSASATNTRSANTVASVRLVKTDDGGTDTSTGSLLKGAEKSSPATTETLLESSPSSLPATTKRASTTATYTSISTTTTYPPEWNSGVDDEASVEAKQSDDEFDWKVTAYTSGESVPSSTARSNTDGDANPAWEIVQTTTVTMASSVPLTTFRPRERLPFGRLLEEGDASEDEEDDQDDRDEPDEDEEDYFSQGVRITVLPPNLSPPLSPRARDATVPAATTLTSSRVDPGPTVNPNGQTYPARAAGPPGTAAIHAMTPETATIPSTDSTTATATMTASHNKNTVTLTPPTSSAYNIPTTVTATTTSTTTTTTTTTTPTTDTTTASSSASSTTSSSATTVPAATPSTTLAPEPDTVATSTTLELQPTTMRYTVASFTTPKLDYTATEKEAEYENYDDEYDDEEEDGGREQEPTTVPPVSDPRRLASTTERSLPSSTEASSPPSTTTTEAITTTTTPSTTTTSWTTTTTPEPTTTTTTTSTSTSTTESTTTTTSTEPTTTTTTSTMATTELDEPTNLPPTIRNRIPKQAIIAGKVYNYPVPLETFQDIEDGNNLRLELLDNREQPLKHNSWIQFNEDTKEIYGLPLEKDVSKWTYKLRASDSGNLSVTETVDIAVQQHKSHRSVNHEISLAVRLNRKFIKNADWQIETIRGIANVLGDVTLGNIVVRDIRNSIQDPSLATFVYTNETLPKDRCPEEKLEDLVALLTPQALNDALRPDIMVKSVQGQQIAQCTKPTLPKMKPTQSITRNFAPQTRNQVDQVNATVGHLLVFKVPVDTFYDPEDGNELKLKLFTTERHPLEPYHWLQFDTKNQEFYGVPRTNDIGRKEYLLMAEDREGLTATDALVVVVNQHHKRDYSVLFELTLDITHEQFSTAQVQRRFIERLAQVFGDASTHYIKIHHVRPIHHTGQVQVSFFNTTLNRQHQRCPQEEIEGLRNILLHQDSTIRAKVRDILGQEFSLQNVSLVPLDNCQGFDTPHHATSEPEKALPPPISKDDYLLTFVLPSVIILIMLLFAFIIACVLYKRRLTGKMELGTDEERKSFRSKGIPVIFQDELDEKPEIGNKSPVILKDEKPPLLPPSYSSTNNDGENEDVDEYVPPPAVVVGGRESRGKSPVTPSYRRPPPYVSP